MPGIDAAPDLPEQDFVVQTAFEAAYLSNAEREEQRAMVGELIGDLASQESLDIEQREKLLTLFDENIRIARGEAGPVSDKSANISGQVGFHGEGIGDQQEAMATGTDTASLKQPKLPGLKQEAVERALKRAGLEIDSGGGKGSHVKVHNFETGKTTTLSSKSGNVNRKPLKSFLRQINLPPREFIKHL